MTYDGPRPNRDDLPARLALTREREAFLLEQIAAGSDPGAGAKEREVQGPVSGYVDPDDPVVPRPKRDRRPKGARGGQPGGTGGKSSRKPRRPEGRCPPPYGSWWG